MHYCNLQNRKTMEKKSILTALLLCFAVLGAKAQKYNVYKADTVIDGNGNKTITSLCTRKELIADHADLSIAGSGDVYIESGKVTSADVSVAGSGTVETRCQLESMDYSITGSGVIRYHGDVKVKGQRMGGKLIRIDSENEKCKTK